MTGPCFFCTTYATRCFLLIPHKEDAKPHAFIYHCYYWYYAFYLRNLRCFCLFSTYSTLYYFLSIIFSFLSEKNSRIINCLCAGMIKYKKRRRNINWKKRHEGDKAIPYCILLNQSPNTLIYIPWYRASDATWTSKTGKYWIARLGPKLNSLIINCIAKQK